MDSAILDEKTKKQLKEMDKDNKSRALSRPWQVATDVIMIAFALFMLVMALLVNGATQFTRLPLFVGFALFVGYIKYPFNKKDAQKPYIPFYDLILAVGSFVLYLQYVICQNEIIYMGGQIGTKEIVIAFLCIAVLVEMTRRATGVPILVVAGAFSVYAFFWLYDINSKTVLKKFANEIYYNLNCGIFSSPIAVCCSFIILFIILGSFLEKTGIGTFFVDLANSLVGTASGGPAKVAVIASALTGMYSGSSVANTVSSGSFTIPTMKKTGYKPEFAAAVEAAASTGGQIMPPIMGAAAFLMAEITGYNYFEIVVAAILPSVLYYAGIFLMVHFEAKRLGLKGLPKDAVPNFFKLLLKDGYLLLPIVILVVCMNFFTAGTSACLAILSALVVSLLDKVSIAKIFKGQANGKDVFHACMILIPIAVTVLIWLIGGRSKMQIAIFSGMLSCFALSFITSESTTLKPKTFYEGFKGGTGSSIGVITACGIAGIISGVVSMTGLGSELINLIVPLASKGPIIALFLTMFCCIVLGMGVPTTANYVIMATITAPILIKMGIPLLCAHMFVFYFGIVADITPPVALAAYAGSAIAKCNPLKAGVQATKLAIAAFIIPYIFALNPAMLWIDTTWYDVLLIIVTSIAGMFGISCGMEGYFVRPLSWWERLLLIGGGLTLIIPGIVTDLIGFILVGGIVAYELVSVKKVK